MPTTALNKEVFILNGDNDMNTRKLKYGFIVLLLMFSFSGFSQQDPLFTQYMNNPGLINPAYAGSKGMTNISGSFRKQWVSMDWSPMTTTLWASTPYNKYDVGLGLTFLNDQIGPVNQTGLYFDYAKYFTLAKNRTLSLGLKAGFNYMDVNLLNLTINEPDPLLALNGRTNHFTQFRGWRILLPIHFMLDYLSRNYKCHSRQTIPLRYLV